MNDNLFLNACKLNANIKQHDIRPREAQAHLTKEDKKCKTDDIQALLKKSGGIIREMRVRPR